MRLIFSLSLIGVLALTAIAQDPLPPAQDPNKPEQQDKPLPEKMDPKLEEKSVKCEARVFIRDIDNKPVDLGDASASLELTPIDGTGPQTIALERVDGGDQDVVPPANNGGGVEPEKKPEDRKLEGDKKVEGEKKIEGQDGKVLGQETGLYGGQVKKIDNYIVELVLWDVDVMKDGEKFGDKKLEGEMPEGDKKLEGEKLEGEKKLDEQGLEQGRMENVAYFRAPFNAEIYWCGTRGHKTADVGGQCDICSRPQTLHVNSVKANVHFKVGDDSKVARDFTLPYFGSGKVLGKALHRELSEIEAGIAAEDFAKIRSHAAHMRATIDATDTPAEKKNECLTLIRRIEDAATARSMDDVKRSAEDLKSKMKSFKDESLKGEDKKLEDDKLDEKKLDEKKTEEDKKPEYQEPR